MYACIHDSALKMQSVLAKGFPQEKRRTQWEGIIGVYDHINDFG